MISDVLMLIGVAMFAIPLWWRRKPKSTVDAVLGAVPIGMALAAVAAPGQARSALLLASAIIATGVLIWRALRDRRAWKAEYRTWAGRVLASQVHDVLVQIQSMPYAVATDAQLQAVLASVDAFQTQRFEESWAIQLRDREASLLRECAELHARGGSMSEIERVVDELVSLRPSGHG